MSLNSFEFQCNFPATGCLIVCGDTDSQMIEDSGLCSTIRCGVNSCASGNHSFVGGGSNNTASGAFSSVLGGCCNTASGCFSSAMGCGLNACDDFTHYVNDLCACGGIYSGNLTNGCAICVGPNGQISQYQGSGGTVECLVAGQNIALSVGCNGVYTVCACQSCSAYNPLFCQGSTCNTGSAYRVCANNLICDSPYSFNTGFNNNIIRSGYSSVFGANNTLCNTGCPLYNYINISGNNNSIINSCFGFVSGNCNTLSGYSCMSSVFGQSNIVCSGFSYTSGLQNSITNSCYSNILNGSCNNIFLSPVSTISGCLNCITCSNFSNIGNGINNIICVASGQIGCNSIGNGCFNRINSCFSSIINGCDNRNCSCYSFIGSGYQNQLTNASFSSIVGGYQNQINQNLLENSYNFIGGGQGNLICNSSGHSILGGRCVEINLVGSNCVIGGFGCGLTSLCAACTFYTNNLCSCGNIFSNNLQNECGVCVGANGQLLGFSGLGAAGVLCATSDPTTTIRTDANNASTGDYSFVLGCFNSASGYYSFINGNNNSDAGQNNVVILGRASFTAPAVCTTYVGCLSVQNLSCGCLVCIGANGILTNASGGEVIENGAGLCSTLRNGVSSKADGNYSASFGINTNVFSNYSTSFGQNTCIANTDCYSVITGGTSVCSSGCGYNFVAGSLCTLLCGNSSFNVMVGSYFSSTLGCYNSSNSQGNVISGNYITNLGGFGACTYGDYNTRAGGRWVLFGGCFNSTAGGGDGACIVGGSYNTSVSGYGGRIFSDYYVSGSVQGGCVTSPFAFVGGGCRYQATRGSNAAALITTGYSDAQVGCFAFAGIMDYGVLSCCFATNLVSQSGSSINGNYGFIGAGQYNCINCNPAGSSHITILATQQVQMNWPFSTTITSGLSSTTCLGLLYSGQCNTMFGDYSSAFGFGNSAPLPNGGVYSFIGGKNNIVSTCLTGFAGVFGCGLTNNTGCSFMSNRLIACNIYGASSICADACGIISPVVSDIRIKDNVCSLDYGIDVVRQLNPVSYEWKDSVNGLGKRLGFIAQELVKIVPESVKEKNGSYMYDDKAILPILAKSIQQISTRIHNLNKNLDNVISKN